MKQKQKQILSEMMQEDEKYGLYDETIEQAAQEYSKYLDDFSHQYFHAGALLQQKQTYSEEYNNTNLDKLLFPELIEEFAKYYGKIPLIENIKQETYSKQQVLELMKQAFEAGFKKADTVEAGLEPKETEQEINWILLKQNNK